MHLGALRIAALPALALLAIAIPSWHGRTSVIGTDGVSYVRSGVGLIVAGSYRDPAGDPELWFPPFYPLLIGVFSAGGRIDPLAVARVISLCAALATVALSALLARRLSAGLALAGVAAGVALALHPLFQESAVSALTESLAALLCVATFALWLRAGTRPRPVAMLGHTAGAGVAAGMAFLTRPETVALSLLLVVTDLAVARTRRVARAALMLGAMAAISSPYIAWLSEARAGASLSGKLGVVAASGRARFNSEARLHIDPQTLEVAYFAAPLDWRSELARARRNQQRVIRMFAAPWSRPLGLALLGTCLVGGVAMWRRGERRALVGLAAFLPYVAVVIALDAKARYLVGTLPALAVLLGIGFGELARAAFSRAPPWRRVGAALLVAAAALASAQAGVEQARQSWLEPGPGKLSLHRDAGRRLLQRDPRAGVVLEALLNVGYYAGKRSRLLPGDDLATITRWIGRTEPSDPVWLAVSSAYSSGIHPSVQRLLDGRATDCWLPVITLADDRGRIVVHELRAGCRQADLSGRATPEPTAP